MQPAAHWTVCAGAGYTPMTYRYPQGGVRFTREGKGVGSPCTGTGQLTASTRRRAGYAPGRAPPGDSRNGSARFVGVDTQRCQEVGSHVVRDDGGHQFHDFPVIEICLQIFHKSAAHPVLTLDYYRPGKPTGNAFNGSLRECLNTT